MAIFQEWDVKKRGRDIIYLNDIKGDLFLNKILENVNLIGNWWIN